MKTVKWLSSENPLAKQPFLTAEELPGQPFLLTEKGMRYRRLMDGLPAWKSTEIQPVPEFGHANLICGPVEQNMGVSFLPDSVTEEAVRRGTVVRPDVQGFEPELRKQPLYHRDRRGSPQMQAVISHLGGIALFPLPQGG